MKEKMYVVRIYDEDLDDDVRIACHSIESYIELVENFKNLKNIKITARLYQAVGDEYPIKK